MPTTNLTRTNLEGRCYNFYSTLEEKEAQRREVTDPRSYNTGEWQSLNSKPASSALQSAIESLLHAT